MRTVKITIRMKGLDKTKYGLSIVLTEEEIKKSMEQAMFKYDSLTITIKNLLGKLLRDAQ